MFVKKHFCSFVIKVNIQWLGKIRFSNLPHRTNVGDWVYYAVTNILNMKFIICVGHGHELQEYTRPHFLKTNYTSSVHFNSSGRGMLIPISSLLFHTVGAWACYSKYEDSLRSTVLKLPLCNQPLWLFCTQQALIATFNWHYSRSEVPLRSISFVRTVSNTCKTKYKHSVT